MNTLNTRSSESGNILIYILGAIVLLGLLVVISKGSVTPGAGIDAEQLMIRVSEVQDYGQELEQAVAYVMSNGHSEVDIRFAHPDADSAYGDITDIPSRQVFSRDGGGARYRLAPDGIQTTATNWAFNGRNNVHEVGSTDTTGGNTTSTELIAFIPNVTKNFCIQINNKNGIENLAGHPPQDCAAADLNNPFNGAFARASQIGDTAFCGGTDQLKGKLEGCFEGGGTPAAETYHYYRVLLAR